MSGFTYPNNAQVRGDFLYVRDANGNIIPGKEVYDGDNITVIDVSYSKQLAYVEYPTATGVSSGYVTNATSLIYYYKQSEWKNGSTTEPVLDEYGTQIGSINPWETATTLFVRADGLTNVVYNTDKGNNTKSGYVRYSGYNSSTDDPVIRPFTYPNNAQVIGDFLYVRDANGNIIPGRWVDDGDNITVLDVSYSTQLALVEYPTVNGASTGYVTNATSLIKYYHQGEWHNGSTPEPVLDEYGTQIGSINPYESATPIFRKDDLTHVVYNTDKGTNTKSGFVRYSGTGVYNPPVVQPPSGGGTPGNMNISTNLVNFVASYEGFSATPYRGADYQNLTIGYGHVILPGENLTYLTVDQAKQLLTNDLQSTVSGVNNITGDVVLMQQKFDALVSFAYNCGVGALSKSTLLKDIKAGASDDKLKQDFCAWSYCNGVQLQGLLNRRTDEWEMYVYGDYVRR